MKLSSVSFFALLVFSCIIFFSPSYAQDNAKAEHVAETTANVPALEGFHEVIYKIWHTAWPEKNIAMLAELLPDVEKAAQPVIAAELPGILRDKKPAWEKNIEALKTTVTAYKVAAESRDSVKLLDAAEQLHSRFEMLVRTIKPVLKEMDAFHSSLYMLYHYYMPEYNLNKIKQAAKEMKSKMDALEKASLPSRLEKREAAFTEAKTKLSKSVKNLEKTVKSKNKETILAGIEELHTDYQALEKVFE